MDSERDPRVAVGFSRLSVSKPGSAENLLENVSGFIPAGGMTAVLGPASCGKSLLMKLLCGRVPGLQYSGQVTLHGKEISPHSTKNGFGFVPQENVLIGDITVRETFEIAAQLRKKQSLEASATDAQEVIDTLGLTKVGDNVIGTLLKRGLSGGEKRRAALGQELVAKPRCIFLDEVTSGLDGSAAYDVIKTVKNLAVNSKGNFSVMMSIHQPNQRMLDEFDYILILSRGGSAFFGTVPEAMAHFSDLGYRVPTGMNPADHILQVIDVQFSFNFNSDSAAAPPDFNAEFANSALGKKLVQRLEQGTPTESTYVAPETTSLWRQYCTLTHREALMAKRDITLYYLQIPAHLWYGFMIGCVFWNRQFVMDGSINDVPGALLWTLMTLSYVHIFKVFFLVNSNMRFHHERANGSYSTLAFFLAETTITAVSHLFLMPGTAIVYYMADLPGKGYPFLLLLFYVMSFGMESLLNVVGKFTNNHSYVVVGAQALLTALTVFGGGVFVKFTKIPAYWSWLYALDMFAHSSKAAMLDVLDHVSYTCPTDDIQLINGSYFCNTKADLFPCDVFGSATSCSSKGLTVLDINSGTHGSKWTYFGYTVLLAIGFRLLVLVLLAYSPQYLGLKLRGLLCKSCLTLKAKRAQKKALKGKEGADARVAGQAEQRHSLSSTYGGKDNIALVESGLSEEQKVDTEGADFDRQILRAQSSFTSHKNETRLLFENVLVTLPNKKVLIDDVTAFATSGRVLALMGPSGAGKTTLLNALSARAVYAKTTGSIRLGNKVMTKKDLDYVPQFDDLNEFFTVRELFTYMSKLKCLDADRTRRIDELMLILGLKDKADERIATLSGGERKRVSIGMGMVGDPEVLFLDEPTTGLDSAAAYSVVQYICRVARQTNVVTIMTIHQPSDQVFGMLEDLLLLESGRKVFFGARADAASFFAGLGYAPPEKTNPADHYLDLISKPPPDGKTGWSQRYLESTYNVAPPRANPDHVVPTVARPNQASRFATVLRNMLTYYCRVPGAYKLRLVELHLVAAFIGSIFPDLSRSMANLVPISGAVFFNIWCVLFVVLAALPTFVGDRRVALQEMLNGAYGPALWCVAQFLASIPFQIGAAIMYQAIFYNSVGFNNDASHFVYSVIITVVLILLMEAICLVVVEVFKDAMLSCIFGMMLLGTLFLFPGYFIKRQDMAIGIRWSVWPCPTTYAFQGSLYNTFHGQDYVDYNGGIITGDKILHDVFKQSSNEDKWQDIGILVAFIIGFRLMHFAVVRFFMAPYTKSTSLTDAADTQEAPLKTVEVADQQAVLT